MVFTDVMPKTVGALRSEQLGLPAAIVYFFLLKVTLPVVWLVTAISNGLLRIFGVRGDESIQHNLTLDELRTIVRDPGSLLPKRRQRMIMSILELEDMTVDELMIPDHEVVGIDLNGKWETVVETINRTQHTRLPVFRGSVQNLAGLLYVRSLVATTSTPLDLPSIESLMAEPFCVPEGTSVHSLLVQFHRTGERTAFIVDEYGDIQGMATMEDVLEEVLGEFSSSPETADTSIRKNGSSGSWDVDAGMNIRVLNRIMHWQLPTTGPTTLNGLILERLETFPECGTTVQVGDYGIEILKSDNNIVTSVRITPPPPEPSA